MGGAVLPTSPTVHSSNQVLCARQGKFRCDLAMRGIVPLVSLNSRSSHYVSTPRLFETSFEDLPFTCHRGFDNFRAQELRDLFFRYPMPRSVNLQEPQIIPLLTDHAS